MPPKVKSINGFSLFVEQVIKRDLERRANGRSISMQEAINHGDPIWKALPPEQREEWKQRAKTHKISPEFQVEKQQHKERYYRQREQLSDPMATRMNKKSKSKTNAVRIDELERMSCRYYDDVDEENFRQKRERDRKDMETYFLWKAPQDEIERRKWMQERCFHVLSAAAYCETREHEFPPSEMSVVSFSFAEGVTNTKHWLIDHGVSEWTDPDAYEAAHRNELSTGIPAEGMRSALVSQYDMTNDYDNILKTLMQKFEGDKHVFVHRRDWNTVMGCIHWLKERRSRNQRSPPHSGAGSLDNLSEERFACIEDLFLSVTKFLDFEVTSTVIADADEQFDKQWDVYMRSAHVLCTFHYSRVGRYPDQALRCSLACARRYTFSMFEMVNDKNYFDDLQIGPNHFPVVAPANGRSEEENATGGATASGSQTGAYGFGVRPIGFNMPSLPLPPDDGQRFDNVLSEEEDDDDSLDAELDDELGENGRVPPTVVNAISFGDDDDFPPTAPPSRSNVYRPVVQPSTSTSVVLPRSVNVNEYDDRRPQPAPQPSRDSQFVRPFSNGNAFSVDRSLAHVQNGLTSVQLNTNGASIASGSGYTSPVETQPPKPKLKPKTLPPSLLNRISSAPRPSASTVNTSASAMSQLDPSGDPSQRLAPRGLGRGLLPTDDDDVSKFF